MSYNETMYRIIVGSCGGGEFMMAFPAVDDIVAEDYARSWRDAASISSYSSVKLIKPDGTAREIYKCPPAPPSETIVGSLEAPAP